MDVNALSTTGMLSGTLRQAQDAPKQAQGASGQAQAAAAGTNADDAKLRQSCKDMESVFMSVLLKSMRETVQKTDLFGSDKDESMFQDMLDDETAKAASKQNGIGLADMLYRQLSQLEKVQDPQKELKPSTAPVEK